MKKITFILTFAFLFCTLLVVQGLGEEKTDNPIFKGSLDWLKKPVPVENADASTPAEMKAYDEKFDAPAPYGTRTFKMLPIPGGKFNMGSPESEKGREEDEGPQVEVVIEPFWMGETEVTWREFELYALKLLKEAHKKSDPLHEQYTIADAFATPTAPYNIGAISFNKAGKDGEYPASGMSYYAAQAYCKWLTSCTGRYYRLPTEAEWEYACRAGSETPFSFGDDADKIDDYAWTKNNCAVGTGYEKVKKKKPNVWGLYDMHGNVAEWVCEQYKKDAYQQRKDGQLKGSVIPVKGNFGQVARGGSCDDEAIDCRSANRVVSVKDWKKQDPQFPQSIWWVTDAPFVGFRVVRPLNPPKTEAEAKLYEPDPEVWQKYSELNQRM